MSISQPSSLRPSRVSFFLFFFFLFCQHLGPRLISAHVPCTCSQMYRLGKLMRHLSSGLWFARRKRKKKKKQTSIQSCFVRAWHPKQGREQLLTHMAVFAHTTRKHNTTQQNTTQALDQLQDRHPQLSRSFVFFYLFFFSNKGNCSLVKLTMHMLAISPSVSPSNRGVEERSGAVVGGREGCRRRFTPGRISAQLPRFVLALPASSNVLSHLFDLPVCVSVRRSSRPGCGSVGGLHQSQRLRHGQLVSAPPPPPPSCAVCR